MNDELSKLREKLESLESEIETKRIEINEMTSQLAWLAGQKSDCLKAIARLTIAKERNE